jgi:hypothetical protein
VSALTEALREEIRAIVREEIARAGVASIRYSSASLPPNTTARTFARWCRADRVDGAERDGQGWTCSAAAWQTARAQWPKRDNVPVAERSGVDLDADVLLRAAGCRRTR